MDRDLERPGRRYGPAAGHLQGRLGHARASQRLDFIKSHLAPALGMKYRMTGSQVLQHPVGFPQAHSRTRWSTTGVVTEGAADDQRATAASAEQLVEQFGDGEEGMAAFKASIGEFLRKTEKLPSSPLRVSPAGLPRAGWIDRKARIHHDLSPRSWRTRWSSFSAPRRPTSMRMCTGR